MRCKNQARSGRERQGTQIRQGGVELVLPRPALGKMQREAACLAGDASGQGEEAPSEGLGGCRLLTQADARCPAGQIVGDGLYGQPGPLRLAQDWRGSVLKGDG